MKNTDIYTDQYGQTMTKKLDKIMLAAHNHTARNFKGYEVNGIMFCDFLETKRMRDLSARFYAECERIGTDYHFGDACH